METKKQGLAVITLYQPWAQFILNGWKTIETRNHNRFECLFGKEIMIHAGANFDKNWYELSKNYLTKEQLNETWKWSANKLPSQILCTAFVNGFSTLTEKHSKFALLDCSNINKFGLYLTDIKPIKPILIKGSQGIWYYETI